MKVIRWIYVSLFFFILSAAVVAVFFLPNREFSDMENRPLAAKPSLSIQTVLSGDFQDGLNDYLSDQFPLREIWMKCSTAIQKLLGKKLIGGVYLGDDHYYFESFTDRDYSLDRAKTVLSLINEKAASSGIPTTVLLAPTPGIVLSDKLPANVLLYDPDRIYRTALEVLPDCRLVYPYDAFSGQTEQIYYRTDHHWTARGAYLAYCEIAGDRSKSYDEFKIEPVTDRFYGTLFSKCLDPAARPDTIEAPTALPSVTVETIDRGEMTVKTSIYDESKIDIKDSYTYFFGGNYELIRIKTDVNNGKKLLLFKDSFANSLVPYLLGEYQEIVMVDLRYYADDLNELYDEEPCEVLFCYEMSNFLKDTGITKISELS